MFSLDKLVSMGFTVAQATVINKFFKRVGYAAKFTTNDLVSGATIPANKIIFIMLCWNSKGYWEKWNSEKKAKTEKTAKKTICTIFSKYPDMFFLFIFSLHKYSIAMLSQ